MTNTHTHPRAHTHRHSQTEAVSSDITIQICIKATENAMVPMKAHTWRCCLLKELLFYLYVLTILSVSQHTWRRMCWLRQIISGKLFVRRTWWSDVPGFAWMDWDRSQGTSDRIACAPNIIRNMHLKVHVTTCYFYGRLRCVTVNVACLVYKCVIVL